VLKKHLVEKDFTMPENGNYGQLLLNNPRSKDPLGS